MQASSTGRRETVPFSSGPEASSTPMTAITMPTQVTGAGDSPSRTPRMTGTRTPREAIGATTPMVPVLNAA